MLKLVAGVGAAVLVTAVIVSVFYLGARPAPMMTAVPDLTGSAEPEARTVLAELGFHVETTLFDTIIASPDPSLQPGVVYGQTPAAGDVMIDASVELRVLRRVLTDAFANGGDLDHDGIPDEADRCPNTRIGEAVIAQGCSANQYDAFVASLPDGTYAFNSPDTMYVGQEYSVVLVLKPRAMDDLTTTADEMRGAVLAALERGGASIADSVRIEVRQRKFSSRMRAALQGPPGTDGSRRWQIRARAGYDEARLISASDSTVWMWDVVPYGCTGGTFRPTLNCGQESLTLAVYAYFGEHEIPWPLLQERIQVRITLANKLGAIASASFPWAGLLLLPAGVVWWVRRRRITILFLAANPHDTDKLNLDEEIRAIDAALQKAPSRNRFRLEQHWAVRSTELDDFLLRHRPDIVHFSGHGSRAEALILEEGSATRDIHRKGTRRTSNAMSSASLARVFEPFKDTVRLVVLNACYSEAQARAIAEHVNCVVGMSSAIGDKAAIEFASSLYQALAYGENVATAFTLACSEIDRASLPDADIPSVVGCAGGTAFVKRRKAIRPG